MCLWAVCFRLLLQASTDIGYLLERSVPDSVYVCDSDGRTQCYKKTSKHLLDSVNTREGGGGVYEYSVGVGAPVPL